MSPEVCFKITCLYDNMKIERKLSEGWWWSVQTRNVSINERFKNKEGLENFHNLTLFKSTDHSKEWWHEIWSGLGGPQPFLVLSTQGTEDLSCWGWSLFQG